MKKIALFNLLIFLIAFSQAQNNWPQIGAKWYYNYSQCDIDFCPGYDEYIYIEATKDTIINDTACVKLIVEYNNINGNINKLGSEFIYSEDDKVYNYHHGHFYLMYDFSLEVGETVNLLLGTNSNIHAVLDEDFKNDSVWVKHTVIERDSIEINGNYTPFLKFDITDPFPDSPFWYHRLGYNKIVKGIGNLSFLFGDLFASYEADYYGPLRCYSDIEINYTTDMPCDTLISSIFKKQQIRMLDAYPNPANEFLTLDFSNESCQILTVKIFNNEGKLLHTGKVNDKHITIDVQMLDQGLYFFKLSSDVEIIGTGKFLKK